MTQRPSLFIFTSILVACGGADVSIGGDDGGKDVVQSNDTGPGVDASSDTSVNDVTTADVSDGAPLFDPSTVSGLALWLDAVTGVTQNGGAVSKWADRTTNHNDASQSTSSQQPMLVATALNGLPVVHFNKDASNQGQNGAGNELLIADSTSLQWGTGDFYLLVVMRFDDNLDAGPERGVGLIYSKTSSGSSFPGVFFTANIPGGLNNGNPPTTGLAFSTSFAAGNYVTTTNAYNNDAAHVFAVQRVGAKLDLRVDGASVASASSSSDNDLSTVGTGVRIGADVSAQGIRFDGDIAEMIAVKGTLATTDRASLESYAKTKWGL
jgi:hypothetical protein